jgi:hypothetical protein
LTDKPVVSIIHPKNNDRVEKELLWSRLLQGARLRSVISAGGMAVIGCFSFSYKNENYRLVKLKNDSEFQFTKKMEKVSKDIRSQLERHPQPNCTFITFQDYAK